MGCGASHSAARVRTDDAAANTLLLATDVEWNADGSPAQPEALRAAITASGGIEPELRPRLWPLLLGVSAWDAGTAERVHAAEVKRAEYASLLAGSDEAVDPRYRKVIDGDVPRTDREHPEWADDASLEPMRSLLMAHCMHSKWGYYQVCRARLRTVVAQNAVLAP
eukprot:5708711-Prymnesium_polylepis.1